MARPGIVLDPTQNSFDRLFVLNKERSHFENAGWSFNSRYATVIKHFFDLELSPAEVAARRGPGSVKTELVVNASRGGAYYTRYLSSLILLSVYAFFTSITFGLLSLEDGPSQVSKIFGAVLMTFAANALSFSVLHLIRLPHALMRCATGPKYLESKTVALNALLASGVSVGAYFAWGLLKQFSLPVATELMSIVLGVFSFSINFPFSYAYGQGIAERVLHVIGVLKHAKWPMKIAMGLALAFSMILGASTVFGGWALTMESLDKTAESKSQLLKGLSVVLTNGFVKYTLAIFSAIYYFFTRTLRTFNLLELLITGIEPYLTGDSVLHNVLDDLRRFGNDPRVSDIYDHEYDDFNTFLKAFYDKCREQKINVKSIDWWRVGRYAAGIGAAAFVSRVVAPMFAAKTEKGFAELWREWHNGKNPPNTIWEKLLNYVGTAAHVSLYASAAFFTPDTLNRAKKAYLNWPTLTVREKRKITAALVGGAIAVVASGAGMHRAAVDANLDPFLSYGAWGGASATNGDAFLLYLLNNWMPKHLDEANAEARNIAGQHFHDLFKKAINSGFALDYNEVRAELGLENDMPEPQVETKIKEILGGTLDDDGQRKQLIILLTRQFVPEANRLAFYHVRDKCGLGDENALYNQFKKKTKKIVKQFLEDASRQAGGFEAGKQYDATRRAVENIFGLDLSNVDAIFDDDFFNAIHTKLNDSNASRSERSSLAARMRSVSTAEMILDQLMDRYRHELEKQHTAANGASFLHADDEVDDDADQGASRSSSPGRSDTSGSPILALASAPGNGGGSAHGDGSKSSNRRPFVVTDPEFKPKLYSPQKAIAEAEFATKGYAESMFGKNYQRHLKNMRRRQARSDTESLITAAV